MSVLAPVQFASTPDELHDLYHVVLFNQTGSHVFLVQEPGGWSLPEIKVPKFTRILAEINEHLQANWNVTGTLLYANFSQSDSDTDLYVALEAPRDCDCIRGLTKLTVGNAAPLLEARQAGILESCCHRILDQADKASPFARLGWIYDLEGWVQRVPGVDKILSFVQLSGSPDTCLMRFETRSKTLWYKAVGQSDPREFSITRLLSVCHPDYLPPILAFDPTLNAWLMESGGASLTEDSEFEIWVTVARRLASLQIASLPHVREVSAVGCIDVRTSVLNELIDPFFDFIDSLMRQQVKNPPAPLTSSELREVADAARACLVEFGTLGIPDVIGHSDFNPGNILIADDRCVFIDWSAAHVGNPALTLGYLIAHFRKNCAAPSGQDYFLREAFREKWSSVVSQSVMRRAQELSPLVAVFASAVSDNSWRDPVRLRHPGVQGYLRSLARIMNREAHVLRQRRLHV